MKNHRTYTILAVDDDADILQFLEKRLVLWGYRVITAESGHQALKRIQSKRPDVVVTDLYMPDGDGFELLRDVKKIVTDLPVIVFSGQGEQNDAIKALRLGAWDYIYKPIVDYSFLQLAIERVLDKARLIQENKGYRDNLEALVAQKSADLKAQQQILFENALSLENTSKALKALLDQREIEKQSIEQTMVSNLRRFVFPYIDDLERMTSDKESLAYVNIIRTNIEQLVAPVSGGLNGAYRNLTAAEIKVADLIRQGHSTKTIAKLLNASPSTVEKHRNKIRKKLKLLQKKVNLQAYLNSLA